MSNDIRENAVVKAIIDRVKVLEGNTQEIDTQHEVSLFEKEITLSYAKGEIEAREFAEAMGLYKTLPASKTETSGTTNPVKESKENKTTVKGDSDKLTKQEKKNAKDRVLEQMAYAVSSAENHEDMMKILTKRIGVNQDANKQAYYQELLDDIQQIKNLMPEYKSYDDVEDSERKLTKARKNKDLRGDFYQEVQAHLQDMSKVEFVKKAYADIEAKFDKIKKENPDMTDYDAVQTLKDELKLKDEYKIAFKNFEEAVKKQAKQAVRQKIVEHAVVGDEVATESDTKWRKVKKEVKEEIKKEGGDKYQLEAAKTPLVDWKPNEKTEKEQEQYWTEISNTRTLYKVVARHNNVQKESISKTKEEIVDVLGKKSTTFDALLTPYNGNEALIKDNGDGTYDLRNLAATIKMGVGADYKMNRYADIDKDIAERLGTKALIQAKTTLESLSDDEVKDLAKLCGFEIEKKNWLKIIGKALGAGAIGAASGAAAEWERPAYQIIKRGDGFELETKLYIGDMGKYMDELPVAEGAELTWLDEAHTWMGVKVIEWCDDTIINIAKDFGRAAIIPGITAGLVGLLDGLSEGDRGEIAVMGSNFSSTDIEEYKKTIAGKSYGPLFTMFAEAYVDKNGNWDVQGYKQFLNAVAGEGGKINKEEAIGAMLELMLKDVPEKTTKPNPNDDCDDDCTAQIKKERQNTQVIPDGKEQLHMDYTKKGGETWEKMVREFYPGLIEKFGGQIFDIRENGVLIKRGAIGALKDALAYNADGTRNEELYNKLLKEGDLPKNMRLPKMINGIVRNDNGDPSGKPITGTGKSTVKEAGKEEYKARVKVIPGAEIYIATDDCTGKTASAGSAKEALDKLKATTGKDYTNEQELLDKWNNK
ncbi:MAG: hypothetical protein E7Z89_02530 [Cyanobacteria bacterium SIG28]|nr:hypothetical protein [Cyanobacteria bacterium SIG28]